MNVTEVQLPAVSPGEECAALNCQPHAEASSKDPPLTEQPVWQMEMEQQQQQASVTPAFHCIPVEEEEEAAEHLVRGKEGEEEEEEETRTVQHEYECVAVTTSLVDELEKVDRDPVLSQSLSGSIPPPMQVQEQSDMFDPQTLQTVVTGCELPNQRTALEGSQVCK